MSSLPSVFVVVLNYNGKNILNSCLSSLFKLDYPNFKVVVVDNNSPDDSFEEARKKFPRATYIKNEENLGFSAGNNVGIRYSLEKSADYVILLNNDTQVESDFLEKIVRAGEASSSIGILSPLIFKGLGPEVWFSGGEIDWIRMKNFHFQEKPSKKGYFKTNFVTGCSMVIKKEVFSKIGLLDEKFFLYWEDADFSVRAKRAGFDLVIVPESRIFHFEKSEEAKGKKLYWLVVSGIIFFRKNSPLFFRPWTELYILLRKAKNLWDLRKKENESAQIVARAYKDVEKSNE